MKRPVLFCEVAEGGLIPGKHLGFYRRNYHRHTSFYVLMPFNMLMRWAYGVWMWCRFAATPNLYDKLVDDAVRVEVAKVTGRMAADKAEAYESGFRDGMRATMKRLNDLANAEKSERLAGSPMTG